MLKEQEGLVTWIEVNMPWKIERSPERLDLQIRLVAVVNDAQQAFKKHDPEIAELRRKDLDDVDEVLQLQNEDRYSWLKGHLKAKDIEAWRQEALGMSMRELDYEIRRKLIALVNRRYAYIKEDQFIVGRKEVVEVQRELEALNKRDQESQFCSHSACKVGVQIEVQSGDSKRTLLIGDITPTGNDDGCCASGIQDEDVVLRYRDLSHLLEVSP